MTEKDDLNRVYWIIIGVVISFAVLICAQIISTSADEPIEPFTYPIVFVIFFTIAWMIRTKLKGSKW